MAFTPSATAADMMFRANPEHTGVYENGGIEPTNTEVWRFPTGKWVGSSPMVSSGVVYVGSDDNNLYAIDAVSGKEKWRFMTGSRVASSPAVSNGIVYVGSYDSNLYAIDAVTGKEKWLFKTESMVESSPAVSNGVVYVESYDNNLYAIDAVTGIEKWKFYIGKDKIWFRLWEDGVGSSPAVSNGVVYAGSSDGNLYAVGVPTSQENTQTIAPTRTLTPNRPAETNGESPPLWDRNILIYLILLVFVVIFGALLYDMYYKNKK